MEILGQDSEQTEQEKKRLYDSIPKGFGEILRFSREFFMAHSKRLLWMSSLFGIPYLLVPVIFHTLYPNFELQKEKFDVFLMMSYTSDVFRENFLDVLVLLSIPLVFHGFNTDLKILYRKFFRRYVHRIALFSVLSVFLPFFFFPSELSFFKIVIKFLLLFVPFYCVFLKEKGNLFVSIKESVRTILPLTLWILSGVVLIGGIVKIPEFFLTFFFMSADKIFSGNFVDVGSSDEVSNFYMRLTLNFPLSISTAILKIIIQPFKSLFYCFLFLTVTKKFFPKEMSFFFNIQKSEKSNSLNSSEDIHD